MNNRFRQQQKAAHMVMMGKHKRYPRITFQMIDKLSDVIRKVGETALKLADAFKEMHGTIDLEVHDE